MTWLRILLPALLVLRVSGYGAETPVPVPQTVAVSAQYEVTKHFDSESKTYYYLTHIPHTDRDGKLIKLRHALAATPAGETVREFALRTRSAVAFNASMGLLNLPPDRKQPVGIQIVDGIVRQDLPTAKRYTLGIKDDNELVAYKPGAKAADILRDGVNDALTAFIPLIENHERVSPKVLKLVGNSAVRHPRQVIAQFDNRDLLFLSCGGRTFDGEGMTAEDLIRILQALDVRFAFNLDGGGSTSTVVEGRLVTKRIDAKGTKERARANFLYIASRP